MKLVKKNTTIRMAKANRANAKASTGPRTAEGIGNSRGNAIKHGVLAEKLPPGLRELNEDASEFQQLRDDLFRAFLPSDPFERLLVTDMADIRWRLTRLLRAEVQLQMQLKRDAESAQPGHTARLLVQENDLDRLIRYEAHLEHQFMRKVQLYFVWRETIGGASAFPVGLQSALPNEVRANEGGENGNGEAASPLAKESKCETKPLGS